MKRCNLVDNQKKILFEIQEEVKVLSEIRKEVRNIKANDRKKEKHKDLVVKELARKLYKSPYSNEVSTTCSPCCIFLLYLIRDERMI